MININCGVLGHVDSGKTTLSKQLSQVGSTNSFDKNPQEYLSTKNFWQVKSITIARCAIAIYSRIIAVQLFFILETYILITYYFSPSSPTGEGLKFLNLTRSWRVFSDRTR